MQFDSDMSADARREALANMFGEHDFVAITYAKVSGEVTTRIAAAMRKVPETDAPKGAGRKMSEDNFRYYEWGRENRFDAGAPGDWASCKIANIKAIEPTTVTE